MVKSANTPQSIMNVSIRIILKRRGKLDENQINKEIMTFKEIQPLIRTTTYNQLEPLY